MTYYLYWLHLETHTDPNTEGYIGVTNDFERRMIEHKRLAKTGKLHLYNAINKYNQDIIEEVLYTVNSREEVLALESDYRPTKNIGWNMAAGGECALVSVRSIPITVFHKSDIEYLYKFNSISDAAKVLGLTIGRLAKSYRNGYSVYGHDDWAVCFDENADRNQTLTTNEVRSKALKGVKKTVPSMFKGQTDRWSEEQKLRIGSHHKGKKLSPEHIEACRKGGRNNSLCVSISLVNQDNPDVVHTFHSISEASRQLNLPLPRLKSKAQRTLNVYGKDGWKIVSLGTE